MKLSLFKIGLLLLLPIIGWAQDQSSSKFTKTEKTKADKYYQQLGYQEAIELYRKGKLSQTDMERMANGYRLNHDTQNAEKWYAQIVDSSDDPLVYLYYAQALHSNGKLDTAKTYYLQYDQMVGNQNDKRGKLLAQSIDRLIEFEPDREVNVENARPLNSEMLDFSPAFYQGGVVFVSNRKPEKAGRAKDLWTGDDFNTLFFSQTDEDGKLTTPEILSLRLADRFHEGPVAFSKGGNQVFYTKNITKKNKDKEYVLKIYTAYNDSGVWGEQSMLDLGDGTSNDAHPSLSPDGQKLYFASDREGGFGGMDLWVSTFKKGAWTTPTNLGPNVNTAGNELFPYIYDDGTLYFASDGWGGLGGLDNFYVEKSDEFTWATPENLDKPFNSKKDDFGYILDVTGTEGYFTSARETGMGKDDIYRFTMKKPQGNKKKTPALKLPICITDAETGELLSDVKINVLSEGADGSFIGFEEDFLVSLKPTAIDGEYTLTLKRRDPFGEEGEENIVYLTDSNGTFQMPVQADKKYILVAQKSGYKEVQQKVIGQEILDGDYCFSLASAQCIALNGKVTNRKFGNTIPNASVELIDLCSGENTVVQSDEAGYFEFPCLPCGCDFVLRGSKTNFKEDNKLASTVDMACQGNATLTKDLALTPPVIGTDGTLQFVTENRPSNVNTNPNTPIYFNEDGTLAGDMLEKGVMIELKDIYYDYGKYNIRDWDAQPDLDNVVRLMQRNPSIHIELRSHTDSRSSRAFNDTLSKNRAKSARDYIVKRGIEPHRITYFGFGENYLVNGCTDGVECTEEAHQDNRRTEVIIRKGRLNK